MKMAISIMITGLIALGTISNVLALNINDDIVTKSDIIFRDDFDSESDYWFWRDTYTAHHTFEDGNVKFTIPNAHRRGFHVSEIWDNNTSPIYKYNNMEIRLKVDNISRGSKGWGFWNTDLNPFNCSLAWFIFQVNNNIFYPMKGLWIMVMDGNPFKISLKRIRGVNIREWHTYDINWTENHVDFYVDNELVAHVTKSVPQVSCRLHVWNDNAAWYFIPIFQRILRSSSLFVDYLEITE